MKFTLRHGLCFVLLKVHYSNQIIKLNSIIDTGSASSVLDINLFAIDYSRRSEIKNMVGIGGKQEVLIQQVERVEIGRILLNNIEIEFGDLENRFQIEAILGNDILNKLSAVIDYKRRQISFCK